MKLKLIQPVIAAVCALATACTPLSAFNTFAPKDPAGGPAVRGLAYGTHDRQNLDVYPPLGAAGAAPVIVFFYGGGWDSGRRQDYAWAGRALAAQGFLTIVADYRLVPEVRFPAFLEDCAGAVRWAQANAARLGGDPQRIVLVGHSAGAYNAVMLALDQRYLAAAGVDANAIRGVIGLAGPYDFYPFDVAASINAFGSYPAPLQTQPVTFARADAPPLLLLHGDVDTTVRPRNSRSLAEHMSAAGGSANVKFYAGVDHMQIVAALSLPFRSRATTLQDVTQFAKERTR